MDKRDAHLSNAELLQSIDGELPDSDAARVERHLSACWSCRGRRDRMERKISDFTLCRDRILAPDLPPSAGGRAKFFAALDESVASVEPVGRASRILSLLALRGSLASTLTRPAAIVSGVVVAVWIVAVPAAAAIGQVLDLLASAMSDPARSRPSPPPTPRLPLPTVLPVLPPSELSRLAPPASPPRPINLVDLELEALWRLHQAGALMGEEVDIGRDASSVWIRARVGTPSRRRELRRALALVAKAGASVHVETFAESSARQKRTPTTVRLHDLAAVAERSPATATLTRHFAAKFGSDVDPRVDAAVRDFSAGTLREARQITLNTFALKRVCGGFSPAALAQASDASRVTHAVLVREYAIAVEELTSRLISDLGFVFNPSPELTRPQSGGRVEELVQAATDLEDAVQRIFAVQIGPGNDPASDGPRLIQLARTVERTANTVRLRTCQ